MSQSPPSHRRSRGTRDVAEAAFKKATTKEAEIARPEPVVPGLREQVSLRIDQDILEHFRAMGPGWQDRINDALRRAIKG
jgi:uncharacterized protein (DUF4415 family)